MGSSFSEKCFSYPLYIHPEDIWTKVEEFVLQWLAKFVGKTNDDAYQVSVNEYDNNFASRYGLLYLKASNDPFTGRILIVDNGDSGEFVSSDESWKEGRKHGKS